MKNPLADIGIITQSGTINKDKINFIAGAMTLPFAEMVWVTTNGDMDTVNRLTEIITSMNTPADRDKLFRIIQMLYGLMGLQFSDTSSPFLKFVTLLPTSSTTSAISKASDPLS